MELPAPPVTATPSCALKAMMLPSPSMPPTRLLLLVMRTPSPLFAAAAAPVASVPIRQAATTLPPPTFNSIPPPEPKRLMTRPRTVELPALIRRPLEAAPAAVPSSSMTGEPPSTKPGCVVPSIRTGSVMTGSTDVGLIVWTPPPAMSKVMVSLTPTEAFESSMA